MRRRLRAGDTGEQWLIVFMCGHLHWEFTIWKKRPHRANAIEYAYSAGPVL